RDLPASRPPHEPQGVEVEQVRMAVAAPREAEALGEEARERQRADTGNLLLSLPHAIHLAVPAHVRRLDDHAGLGAHARAIAEGVCARQPRASRPHRPRVGRIAMRGRLLLAMRSHQTPVAAPPDRVAPGVTVVYGATLASADARRSTSSPSGRSSSSGATIDRTAA